MAKYSEPNVLSRVLEMPQAHRDVSRGREADLNMKASGEVRDFHQQRQHDRIVFDAVSRAGMLWIPDGTFQMDSDEFFPEARPRPK